MPRCPDLLNNTVALEKCVKNAIEMESDSEVDTNIFMFGALWKLHDWWVLGVGARLRFDRIASEAYWSDDVIEVCGHEIATEREAEIWHVQDHTKQMNNGISSLSEIYIAINIYKL